MTSIEDRIRSQINPDRDSTLIKQIAAHPRNKESWIAAEHREFPLFYDSMYTMEAQCLAVLASESRHKDFPSVYADAKAAAKRVGIVPSIRSILSNTRAGITFKNAALVSTISDHAISVPEVIHSFSREVIAQADTARIHQNLQALIAIDSTMDMSALGRLTLRDPLAYKSIMYERLTQMSDNISVNREYYQGLGVTNCYDFMNPLLPTPLPKSEIASFNYWHRHNSFAVYHPDGLDVSIHFAPTNIPWQILGPLSSPLIPVMNPIALPLPHDTAWVVWDADSSCMEAPVLTESQQFRLILAAQQIAIKLMIRTAICSLAKTGRGNARLAYTASSPNSPTVSFILNHFSKD